MGVVAGKMSIRAVAGKLLALQLRAMPEPEEYRVVGQHGSSGVQHRPVPVEVGELPPPSTQGPNHRRRQPLQQPPAVLSPLSHRAQSAGRPREAGRSPAQS